MTQEIWSSKGRTGRTKTMVTAYAALVAGAGGAVASAAVAGAGRHFDVWLVG